MEKYYSVENLINEKRFAYKNSFVLPIAFALSKIIDYSNLQILIEKFEEMEADEVLSFLGLDKNEYETILKYCFCYNIKNGVSEVGVLSLDYVLETKVLKELGLKGKLYLRANDVLKQDFKESIKYIENEGFNVSVFIDPYYAGDDISSKISELTGKYKIPVILQMFDDLDKTGMINSIFNKLPINYIEDLGFLDRDCTIFGCVVADKEDFNVLSNYGAKIIVSPYESMNFGRGSPNVYAMKNAGLEVDISAYICCDIEKEIDYVTTLSRGILNDSSILPTEEVLDMAISKNERINLVDFEKTEFEFKKILEKIKEKI